MDINFKEQSYETLFYLVHHGNNILQETAVSVKEFEQLTTLLNENTSGIDYHFSVLKDLLSGEAKDSFEFIENLFIQTQEVSLKLITDFANKMSSRFTEQEEIIAILKSKET